MGLSRLCFSLSFCSLSVNQSIYLSIYVYFSIFLFSLYKTKQIPPQDLKPVAPPSKGSSQPLISTASSPEDGGSRLRTSSRERHTTSTLQTGPHSGKSQRTSTTTPVQGRGPQLRQSLTSPSLLGPGQREAVTPPIFMRSSRQL